MNRGVEEAIPAAHAHGVDDEVVVVATYDDRGFDVGFVHVVSCRVVFV